MIRSELQTSMPTTISNRTRPEGRATDYRSLSASSYEDLLANNQLHLERFDRNPLFSLVKTAIFGEPKIRDHFLDCLQVWSDKFQKMVLARAVFSETPTFARLAEQHLSEEFGHNIVLSKARNGRPAVWDAVLEAAANWFPWKMLTLSELGQIVLVHMVVESSATVFYKHVTPTALKKRNSADAHFDLHRTVDDGHQCMGKEELEQLSPRDYEVLSRLQGEGWEMLNLVMGRIAELTSVAASELERRRNIKKNVRIRASSSPGGEFVSAGRPR